MGRRLLLAAISGAWVLAATAAWIWLGVACQFDAKGAGVYWGMTWIILGIIIAIPFCVYNWNEGSDYEYEF